MQMNPTRDQEAATPDKSGDQGKHAPPAAASRNMLGQIAHDFNNLLTPLLAYPDLIKRDLPEGCRGRELLDVLRKTAEDMAHISQQLLAMSGRAHHKKAIVHVNNTVKHVLTRLADDSATNDVEIVTELAPDLFDVKGSPEQIIQVVQNLCRNALDALENAGRILVKTENVYIDTSVGSYNKVGVGEYVRLSVADNGAGIPDHVKDQIFEPFFTTRRASKKRGSGLGLTIIQSIARDLDGIVDFETTLGKGTTFSIYLPVYREEVAVADPKVTPTAQTGETVLIVDDDARQREVISELFTQNGYQTTGRSSGEAAVQYMSGCATNNSNTSVERFPDLIVMDVIMEPGINGREACKRIMEFHPKQRVIMVSGYYGPEDAPPPETVRTVTYVSKPLTWGKISEALKELDESGEPMPSERDDLVPCNSGRILIVDDEEGIRKLFHMLVSAAFPKSQIDLAPNGADAVESFRAKHHAVVLMDLRMPVMDGREAFMKIQALCEHSRWQRPSVIFCTGFAPPSAIQEIVRAQAGHSLLTKPISGDDLIGAVKKRLVGQK
jgi:CheY-like chemotaxis protein/nitrogen-specific signal transduction histidine kinase